MNEIEAWIVEEDKKLEGKNISIIAEHDNGEDYEWHVKYIYEHWFKTNKEAFDFVVAKTNYIPILHENELIFMDREEDFYNGEYHYDKPMEYGEWGSQYVHLLYLKSYK